MKRKNILSLSAIMLLLSIGCGPKAITYDYEAVCDGIGAQGFYRLKIFTYGKDSKDAKEKSRSHAVHAVLFKGVMGSSMCQPQKPICNVSYSEKKEWFDNFFESGDYLRYVSFTEGGYVDAADRVKMPGGKYKIGVSVTVSINDLRKLMENQGLSRSLNQGF